MPIDCMSCWNAETLKFCEMKIEARNRGLIEVRIKYDNGVEFWHKYMR